MNGLLKKYQQRVARSGLLLTLAFATAIPGPALAALLGNSLNLPFISYDNQGTTSYDAASDSFSVAARPLAILVSGNPPAIIGGVNSFAINISVDDTGALTGGVPGDDLVVTGDVTVPGLGFVSGVLLTGEVTGFGFEDSGSTTDSFDFTFTVTGGLLASLYPTTVGVSLNSEQSNFTGHFTVNFGGEAKGTLGGIPGTAALGDRVWEDLNADGIQDCSDTGGDGVIGNAGDTGPECGTGIPGVIVSLFTTDSAGDCTISLGMSDTTDMDGFYLFDMLDPGDYCVEFVKPGADFCNTDGFELGEPQFTLQNAGNDDVIDSDANPADGITDTVNLSAGETDLTVDAGIYCPAKIGDRVWFDDNQDGLQDNGEDGVEGVTIRLFDCGPDGVAGTGDDVDTGESRVTDDVDGLYMFGAEPGVFDLEPGDYYVKFDPTTFPPGFDFTVPKVGSDDAIDSDCLPADGISACTTLGSRGINLNRDCGIIPPPPNCDLDLDKKCRVEPQPPADFDKCKGKLQQFTVIWTGDPISISGLPNDAPGGAVGTNQEVTFFGPFSQNDVVVDITGSVQGQSTFHMSCSDDDFNSPDDCGKLAGDGKDKSGFINLWRLEGFIDAENRVLDCTPDADGEFADNCSFTPTPVPSCETLKANKEKLSSLTFAYTGGGCPGDNDQGKKSSCSGSINPLEGATVQAGEKEDKLNYPVVPMFVAPDGEFTIDPDKFKSNSFLVASNTGGTEVNEFHTSCSQPLAVGDVFGSFTLVAMNGQSGSTEVTYQYIVTNNGDPVTNVVVTDVPLGDIGGPIDLGTGESNNPPFTKTVSITGTTVNTATATGELPNGEICSASDTVTVEVVVPPAPPAECKELKPIDALILEYDASQAGGRSIDQVSWYRDKFDADDQTKNLINTTGPVVDGQVISFDGFAAADAKNDVDFFIKFTDGSTATSRFHRSCSDDEMNDISDCGNLLGDGKKDDSGLNTWILRDLAGNGKVLGCP